MSKALVIKGANFAANKVETISIQEVVPCTGISLSYVSYAFTAIGATKTLAATVTPADTTESVIWLSSNTDCVTVVDGVVTCVGVGSATITASCGEQTASCAISATVTINANTDLSFVDGYSVGGSDLQNSKDYISYYVSNKSRSYLSENVTTAGYQAVSSASTIVSPWDALYPIMIPRGASKVSISAPAGLKNHVNIVLLNSTLQPTYNIKNKGVRAIYDVVDIKSTMELSLDGYTGYDSCSLCLQTTGADASTITGDVTVTFS